MDKQSMWFGSVGLVGALLVALIVFSLTGPSAKAQEPGGMELQNQSQSIKLAQTYYYPYYPQVRRKRKPRRRRVVKKCSAPWIYSRGLRRCICVKEGYTVSGGRCVKVAEVCPKNARWSDDAQKCQCEDGFVKNGDQCFDPNADVVTYDPSGESQCLWPRVKSEDGSSCGCAAGYREDAGRCVLGGAPEAAERPRARADETLTSDVSLLQQCLKEAGYLRAPVRDRMGKKAWTAFWFFKQDYSVGRTPKGVHDARAQHKLFTLCPKVSGQLAARPAMSGPPVQAAQPGVSARQAASLAEPQRSLASRTARTEIKPAPEVKAPVKRVYARPEAGCLPSDLYSLIVGTYGGRPNLKKCTQTCIAMPAGITKKEIEEYESKRGIRWCRNCIELSTQLPLEEILLLERGANVQVCTRPPSRLPKWSGLAASSRRAYTKIRALYTPFPPGAGHGNDIAVVIGNSTYQNGLPVNASASANAGAVYATLTEHLRYRQENIIDLRDASLKQLRKVFGSKEDYKGDLWRRVQGQPGARVLIYYAGHAGTRSDQSDSYLLPVDAVKYREERGSYAMSLLYANLEKLGAKSVLLLLEAGFGRDLSDFVFPPNLPEIQVSALPAKPSPGLTVLLAADRDQKTLDDPKYGIGLFTRYLIEGLAGRADLEPIGNRDRVIDVVELFAYTSHMVRLAARKSFGLLQKPTISRQGNLRVTRVQAQSQ